MCFMSKKKTSWSKINALFHTVTLIFVQSDNLDHSDSFELRILLGKQESAPAYHQTSFSKTDTLHTSNQSKSSVRKKNKFNQHDVTVKSRSSQPTVLKTTACNGVFQCHSRERKKKESTYKNEEVEDEHEVLDATQTVPLHTCASC